VLQECEFLSKLVLEGIRAEEDLRADSCFWILLSHFPECFLKT